MASLNDPILVFTLLVLVMLLMPLLAERLRVPDLVLLLLAGFVIGPHGMGLLARTSAITLFGSVGLLYIMFLAGLEIDLQRFAQARAKSIFFGLLTFAIPQGVGMVVAHYLLGLPWPTSILLASLFASHTLLAYPIASRLGIARQEPVTVTVGATIITDTLALLVLAVIVDSARGMQLGVLFWLQICGGLLTLICLAAWGIPRLTRWFFHRVPEAGSAQFLFVLVTVCGFAYLSHFAKMEPIIGAFLAGAAFSRLIPAHSVLMSRVVFSGNTLFIPFFLISVGMLIDPVAFLKSPRSWGIGSAMVVLVVVLKYVAAWLAGKMFGYTKDAQRVMFGLSVVQAAATLAAVLVGFELKIFDDAILNGAIAMIVVTCPLGAWIVERHGRNLAALAQPCERPIETTQHILVPVANPAFATKLLDLAFLLRDMGTPGSIHPVSIVRDEDDIDEAIRQSEKLLADCSRHAAAANFTLEPAVRVDTNTCDGISRMTKEVHAELVLSGWGGARTASIRLFGSVMELLIDTCPARLLFCRLNRPLNTSRRLLLLLTPLVEQRSDVNALLRDVKNLARQMGAELRVYLAGAVRQTMRPRIQQMSPSQTLVFVEADTWMSARSKLLSEVGTDDLIFTLGERRLSPHWTSTLDKFSTLLVTRYPQNNLLLDYPAFTVTSEMSARSTALAQEEDTEKSASRDEHQANKAGTENHCGA